MTGKQEPSSRSGPQQGYAAVGFVRRPHGLRGEIVVEPLTDFPERFDPGSDVWAAGRRYRVRAAHVHRGALLVELNGIATREDAETLRGELLEVPDADLAKLGEDKYYRHQLIGMQVLDSEGNALGALEEVLDTGANDVYLVRGAGGELLLPAIDTVIKRVDVGRGRMTVQLMPGMEYKPPKRPKTKR